MTAIRAYIENRPMFIGVADGCVYYRKAAVRKPRDYSFRDYVTLWRGGEIVCADGMSEFLDDDLEES